MDKKDKVTQHCICKNCKFSDMYYTCLRCGIRIPYCRLYNDCLICTKCQKNESLHRLERELQRISSNYRDLQNLPRNITTKSN